MEAENRAYKRWDHVSNLEESFLKQKLKMHWLKKGDKNNKSFNRAATMREIRNSIKEIQCDDGIIYGLHPILKLKHNVVSENFCSISRMITLELQWRSERVVALSLQLNRAGSTDKGGHCRGD